jgi:predicted ester cyclase
MSIFRRKKKDDGEIPMIVQLYFEQDAEPLEENREIVEEHLENVHKGKLAEEKRAHDFVELGMTRAYLDALDDIEFTLEETLAFADQVSARWTVRGIHRRDMLGLEPTGQPVTVEGLTICVVKYERVRQQWSYWEIPGLEQKLAGV